MAPDHPTREKYTEQQYISHGYNTVGEKTMAPAHSTVENIQRLKRSECFTVDFVENEFLESLR